MGYDVRMRWAVRLCVPLLAACSHFEGRAGDVSRTSEDGGGDDAAIDARATVTDGGDGGGGAEGCIRRTTGFRSPTVLENFGAGATWTNLDRGAAQDDQSASVVLGGGAGRSAALVASGFGLTLPPSPRGISRPSQRR